jgi:pseudaminic acid cytidylyltransferase
MSRLELQLLGTLCLSMKLEKKIIAIIPARGGSKRIPRKNVREFAGKPMIYHAIKVATESGLFDHTVVSTDDNEIADVALAFGAEVPFRRPSNLSKDDTPTVPVIADAIVRCKKQGWDFDQVCCIYPCVPFLKAIDLMESWHIHMSSSADFCFPIVEYPSPVQRALKVNAGGFVEPLYPENELTRTQDLVPSYHDAGQFYWGSAHSWLTKDKIHNSALGYIMPHWRVIDIDTLDDWHRAELMLWAQAQTTVQ